MSPPPAAPAQAAPASDANPTPGDPVAAHDDDRHTPAHAAEEAPATPPISAGDPSPTHTPAVPVFQTRVSGTRRTPSRGAGDVRIDVGGLSAVPRRSASEAMKLAPGVLLTSEGSEAHAEQVFLRGFDAREGQDIEFSVGGIPINESGNLHGNGYADTHFIIPELITHLRLVEGPFDPRQGNYAVAGSAEFELGLAQRGLSTRLTVGSFGTWRALVLWGPRGTGPGTFAAAELYTTDGYGANRDGRRASVLAQHEGRLGDDGSYRVLATAYVASFHSAGVLRDDDLRAGRVDFFGTYDPRQGADTSRYSIGVEAGRRLGDLTLRSTVFGIARPMRLRENFTGYLLDTQEPTQRPHPQRGDGLDLEVLAFTVGARGMARLGGRWLGRPQQIEVGYFARGDFVSSSQRRVEAATGHPYKVDADLESRLGDIGLYTDLDLHPLGWLTLRGGVRADLFTYDVLDRCAVQSVAQPSRSDPPGDASCLSQQDFGRYRDPTQRATTSALAFLPRATVVVGPFAGLELSASYGRGARSIDPQYVTQDAATPLALADSVEMGAAWSRVTEGGVEIGARAAGFLTRVDRDLIFAETAGRNVLGGATRRLGGALAVRATGSFFDISANATVVRATFEDTGDLIPYVPELVVRGDGILHGDLPWLRPRGRSIHASVSSGLSWVTPRPLPYGERGNTIFTLDAAVSLSWWQLELIASAMNLTDYRYRIGEYNYVSDFRSRALPTLVPVRHFTAGAPRTVMLTLAVNFGGA